MTIRGSARRGPSCGEGRPADEAPGPEHGEPAIERPYPRCAEYDSVTLRASCHIERHRRTCARRVADVNAVEISRGGVGGHDLQDGSPLALPDRGYQALGRRGDNGCNKQQQRDADAVHVLHLRADGGMRGEFHMVGKWQKIIAPEASLRPMHESLSYSGTLSSENRCVTSRLSWSARPLDHAQARLSPSWAQYTMLLRAAGLSANPAARSGHQARRTGTHACAQGRTAVEEPR